MLSRVDTSKYAFGLRTCRNAYVRKDGGVSNRPGSEFVCEIKDSTKTVRLIPFIFNDTQTYMLEFGDQYIRIIKNGVQQTLTAQNITGITNANPAVVTYSGSDTYANGDEVYISGIVGAISTYLNGRNFKVANVNTGTNTFELKYMDGTTNVNSTSFGSYTSGGTVAEVYTLSSPYVEADLQDLQFSQSADVITISHKSYTPKELSRTSDTSWSLDTISFIPNVSGPSTGTGPTPTVTNNSGATDITHAYTITSVRPDTNEESLVGSSDGEAGKSTLSDASYMTIDWTGVLSGYYYNIYKDSKGGAYLGTTTANTFNDIGQAVDYGELAPTEIFFEGSRILSTSNNYPACVVYCQQRRIFANSNNNPETGWASRIGSYTNYTRKIPISDDGTVIFSLAGNKVNEIKHLLSLGRLVILTSGGVHSLEGDGNGIITPGQVNPKQHSSFGATSLSPVIVGGSALYVQANGSAIRDIGFTYEVDGYRGNDVTAFASHLFRGHEIESWSYQESPESIVWAVRDDGKMVALTYIAEQQILAWHRHDTDGTYEQVCCIPEGNEYSIYTVVNRTINGSTKRYIERSTTRLIGDIEDLVLLDCSLSYDGRNTSGSNTMTLSGGTDWDYEETLTLTSSASYFASTDVGNVMMLTGADGSLIRFTIGAYSSATVVTGNANRDVPTSLRSTATTNWAKGVDQISGLWHLEGQDVAVFADGFVIANPNNAAYTTVTVTNGQVTLERPYAVIHIGLPYTSDVETLDIDTVNGQPIAGEARIVNAVKMHLEETRGLWLGSEPPSDDTTDPLEGLYELKVRNEESMDDPPALFSGVESITIQGKWNTNGRVFIRQIDPVPFTLLSVIPDGLFPFKG